MAIFLTLTIFMVSTGTVQLLKIPQLIVHFTEHNQQNPTLGFQKFLAEHYLGHEPDNDYQEDMKLPFKKVEYNASSFVFFNHVEVPTYTQPTTYYTKPNSLYRFSYKSSEITLSIWQPPKNV